MATMPLMPKATAVWLVENTSLTFDQIGEFCGLHALEVQAIADGEVAVQMQGLDPIANGQLTLDEIEKISATGGVGRWTDRADRIDGAVPWPLRAAPSGRTHGPAQRHARRAGVHQRGRGGCHRRSAPVRCAGVGDDRAGH